MDGYGYGRQSHDPSPWSPTGAPDQESRTILLVESELRLTVILARILASAGYVVLTACSSKGALAVVRAPRRVDLVITDLGMPEMDGAELLREIGHVRPGLPSIAMAGADRSEVVRRLPPGAEVCVKPLRRVDVLASVSRQLRWNDAQADTHRAR